MACSDLNLAKYIDTQLNETMLLSLMPHGSCFLWNRHLTALHVTTDVLISVAYFSIPTVLVLNRHLVAENAKRLLLLFAAFILSCGVGHSLQAWNIWHAQYWLEGGWKSVTAFVSIVTAWELRTQIPVLLGLQKDLEETQELATRDALTHLLNRRGFEVTLGKVSQHLESASFHYTLLMVDLDNFKAVNDTFGHPAGDHLLQTVSTILTQCTRSADIVARLGGDEFAVILIGCSIHEAKRVAENIRMAIAHMDLQNPRIMQQCPVSASLGLLELNASFTCQQIYAAVDKALYQAKRAGKNQIVAGQLGDRALFRP